MYVVDARDFKWIVNGVFEHTQCVYLKPIDGKLTASFRDPAMAAFIVLSIPCEQQPEEPFDLVFDMNKTTTKFIKKLKDKVSIELGQGFYVIKSGNLTYRPQIVNKEFAKYEQLDLNKFSFNLHVTIDAKDFKDAVSLIDQIDIALHIDGDTFKVYGMEYGKKQDIEAEIELDADYGEYVSYYARDYLKYIADMAKDTIAFHFNTQQDIYPLKADFTEDSFVVLAPRIVEDE